MVLHIIKNTYFAYSDKYYNYQLLNVFFSSPEPKVRGELLVSKGDTPASVVMRQQSSSSLKLLDRFISNLVCSILVTVTLEFAHVISVGPF
jgi:hypothetical protein